MIDTVIAGALGSLLGGLALTIILRVGLNAWKRIVVPLGLMIVVGLAASLIIYGSLSLVREVSQAREIAFLQERIEKYIKGNHSTYFEEGFTVNVVMVKPRVWLGFTWPHGSSDRYGRSPIDTNEIQKDIVSLVNNEGYPGTPVFGYTLQPVPINEVNKLISD